MGLFARYSGPRDLVYAYLGSGQDASNSTTKTFSGLNLGSAAANRYIIVCVGVVGTVLPTVTINPGTGAITMTNCVSVKSSFGNAWSAVFIASVPTGTSGSVTLTPSSGVTSISLYSVKELLSSTPTGTDTNFYTGSLPLSMSPNASLGGLVIATAFCGTGSPGASASWTGLDSVDLNIRFAGNFQQHSCGRKLATAAGAQNMSVTLSGVTGFSCAAASFR